MKPIQFLRQSIAAMAAVALMGAFVLPSSAFFWKKDREEPVMQDILKNGLIGSDISFSEEDFKLTKGDSLTLQAIQLDTLPDPKAGVLLVGEQPLSEGSRVEYSALAGLRFHSSGTPEIEQASFQITPIFSNGELGDPVSVTMHLLTKENKTPIARNMDLSTYKNVAITGYFDAIDGEGDTLTFQLTSSPARGAVEMAEDGSSQFVYTPYENKTGQDTFTYVAVDPAGNISPEAEVTVRIEKAETTVTYADLQGHPAHKAAIHLAQEGICVGACVQGNYFFEPDQPVSRVQFLAMAMDTVGLEPLEDLTTTGFADDSTIPTWAKGTIGSALKAGVIQGERDENGAPVFGANNTITAAQASVMLNQMLHLADVPVEVFSAGEEEHWATQSVANLAACGVLRAEETGTVALEQPMTRAEAAQMLDGVIALLEERQGENWWSLAEQFTM